MNLPQRIADILRSSAAAKKCILPPVTVLQSPYGTKTNNFRNPEPVHSDSFTASNSAHTVSSAANVNKNFQKKDGDSKRPGFSGAEVQDLFPKEDTNSVSLGFSGGEVQKIPMEVVENSEQPCFTDRDIQEIPQDIQRVSRTTNSAHLGFTDAEVREIANMGVEFSKHLWSSAAKAQKFTQRDARCSERLGFTGADVRKISQKEVRNLEHQRFTDAELHKASDKDVRECPRPRAIPFQAKIANLVHLIGRVGVSIQSGALQDGTTWAATVLVQEEMLGFPQFVVPVIFKGDLAKAAARHLREKDAVYISGELCSDSSRFAVEHCQTNLQVMVKDICFVDKIHPKKKSFLVQEKKEHSFAYSDLWNDLLVNPHKWCDYRNDKITVRHPDFKHMESGQGLWVDGYVPEQVLLALKSPKFCARLSVPIPRTDILKDVVSAEKTDILKDVVSTEKTENQWADLVTNPHKWLDYRSQKLNGLVSPRFPDFKHEDTGKPLWLNCLPSWVSPKLKELEFKVNIGKQKKASGVKLWLDLVTNPDNWWDCRLNKINRRRPDFKHKENGEALWLDQSPEWVLHSLKSIKWEQKT